MSSHSQISVTVSESTKEKLDRFTASQGLQESFVIEHALLYFMEARRELPDEAFTPKRIVLEEEAFERLVERLDSSPAPTDALRELWGEFAFDQIFGACTHART